VNKVVCWHYESPVDKNPVPDSAPPPELDWDLWLGPLSWRAYNAKYCHGTFRWIMESGGGQIRDRGAHVMSNALWIMNADRQMFPAGRQAASPVTIEATGTLPTSGLWDTAVTMEVTYQFRNPDWTLVWAQPGVPSATLDARYGAVYWGDSGNVTVTLGDGAGTATDQKAKDFAARCDCGKAFRSPGHSENFEDCIRTREKPIMHMEAAHRVASLCILGNVSFQLQRKLEWDPVAERVKDDDEANRMLSRPGRGPWHL
jgi:hypothetical protein